MTIQVDPSPLYEQRVIVLMESRPQSNHYHQIILDREQFINITQHLGKVTAPPPGAPPTVTQGFNIEMDDTMFYVLDAEIKSVKP
jgi:hypothetical protein